MRIDVFSDVVCPWCFVGKERLQRALEQTGLAETAEVIFHPFLLQPDTPKEGRNIHEYLSEKYGQEPIAMFSRVEREAESSGLHLHLAKQPMTYPTIKAHTLLRHALAKGTQRALAGALFKAHFQDAENISDHAVLAQVAAPHGFAAVEVERLLSDATELALTERQADRAHAMGITGVPFFVLDGKVGISGCQPHEVFVEALSHQQKLAAGELDADPVDPFSDDDQERLL